MKSLVYSVSFGFCAISLDAYVFWHLFLSSEEPPEHTLTVLFIALFLSILVLTHYLWLAFKVFYGEAKKFVQR